MIDVLLESEAIWAWTRGCNIRAVCWIHFPCNGSDSSSWSLVWFLGIYSCWLTLPYNRLGCLNERIEVYQDMTEHSMKFVVGMWQCFYGNDSRLFKHGRFCASQEWGVFETSVGILVQVAIACYLVFLLALTANRLPQTLWWMETSQRRIWWCNIHYRAPSSFCLTFSIP